MRLCIKNSVVVGVTAVVFLLLPTLTFAAGSATIGAVSPSDTVGVGTQVSFSVVPSGFTGSLSYKVVDSFGGGVTNANLNSNGDFFWVPNNSDVGSHTITVTVTDTSGNTASAAQTITVTAPTVSVSTVAPSATVEAGIPVSFSVSSSGFLSPQYSISDSFTSSTVSYANTDSSGYFHWTPVFQDIGVHTLTATAHDYLGHVATASTVITVTGPLNITIGSVSPSNTVHAGDNVSFTTTPSGSTSYTFSITDNFTSGLGTSSLAIDGNGKTTWKPNSNDIGPHLFTVTVTDAQKRVLSAAVTITVIQGSPTPFVPTVTPSVTQPTTITAPVSASATTAAYTFKMFLSVGSSGADAMALQQLLLKLGFFTATPTGYFGTVTKVALQKYQTAHGIEPVGYAGPATRASLSTGR